MATFWAFPLSLNLVERKLLMSNLGVSSGTETTYPSGTPEVTPVFSGVHGSCYSIFSFRSNIL